MTDEEPSQDRIAELIKRINQMDEMLRRQAWRIYHLEQRLGSAPERPAPLPPERPARRAAEPPSVSRPPVTQPPVTPPPVIEPLKPAPGPPAAAPPQTAAHDRRATAGDRSQPTVTTGARPPTQPPLPSFASSIAAPQTRSRGDLEARIGGNWFQRIGVIAVTLGVAFFLKYAYDNAWIGKGVVLWVCIAFGVVMLITGERLRPRYHNYAYGLTGLGILVLYTCFYAAYGLLHLWQPVPAFVGMVLVTATASLLAARYNALPIAMLGLIGGFLTPIVLSTHRDNEVGLFSYIALLDLGVLALAYSKQWRALNYMAFAATVFMFIAWCGEYYAPAKLWPTVGFLTLFFAIFALLAVLYNVLNWRPTRWLDLAMVFANALLYFSTSYGLLEEQFQARLGLLATLVSAFYLALGYFTYRRDREDRLLLYTFWGLAILFAVLAVPIQFHQQWITMGWAIEGAILTWIGLRVNDRISRYGALVVFLIAVTHWLMADLSDFAYHADAPFVPLWNQRGLSCAVLIAMLAAAASFYKRFGAQLEAAERQMFASLYTLGANALVVTWLTLDANDYFGQAQAQAYEQAGKPVGFGASAEWKRLDNQRHLILSALWSVYAAVALAVGTRRNLKALRVAALLLLVLTGMKLFFRDLLYYDATWHKTIFNPTFAAFAAFVAACAVGAWFYGKSKELEEEERSLALVVLVGAANLFAVIALSAEALGYFERIKADPSQPSVDHLENMKLFAVSAVWIIYGAISSLIGIRRALWGLRMASFGLLGLAAVKLLVMDLRYYDASWHTMLLNPTFAAFALLIAVLVAVAWFYQRAAAIDEVERQRMVPIMIGAANLLAVLALSAEGYGYYATQIARAPRGADLSDLLLAQKLSLTVVWTVYGGLLLTFGLVRRRPLLRLMALLLLGLTILKVYLLDIWSLKTLYRVIALILLGGVLLLVSFLYQPLRRRLTDEEQREE